ncbi:MAG: DUF3261 domain-containing protein [Polyangiales bacterium]
MTRPLPISVLACVLLLVGCRAQPRPDAHVRVAPAGLLPPNVLGYDFQWQQRVTARWPTGRQGFDAVLQKRGAELMMVGLSPLGLPGFVLSLRESGEIEVVNRTGRKLPFEPRYVIADIQRTFFPWLPPPPAAGYSGELSGQVGDQHVVDVYGRGLLVARRFERPTAQGLERVEITYHGHRPAHDAPKRAVLKNKLLGYVLTIDTVQQARLPP